VAYANQTYYSRGLKKQMEDLHGMKELPGGFLDEYHAIIHGDDTGTLPPTCLRMLKSVKAFLDGKAGPQGRAAADAAALAGFYEEGISTWNKIYASCDTGNTFLAFISGVCLQGALDDVSRELGLGRWDLMGAFRADNLEAFRLQAQRLQLNIEETIRRGGAMLKAYPSVDDFLGRDR
jgi:hypothetical protein